jgi:hypothetical protein
MDIEKLSDFDLAYLEGLVEKCAEAGVDPELLLEKAGQLGNMWTNLASKTPVGRAAGALGRATAGIQPQDIRRAWTSLATKTPVGRAAGWLGKATAGVQPQDVKRVAGNVGRFGLGSSISRLMGRQ